MKFALTLAVILGLAMISQAALVTQQGSISVDVTVDTTTPPSAGLTAYQFTLSSNLGIYGVDGRIDGRNGAVLGQQWAFGSALATPVADPVGSGWSFLTAAQQTNDSTILVPSANQVIVRAATENLAGNFLAGDAVGTTTMAFGLKALAPLTDLTNVAFSRLVVADTLNVITLTAPTSGPYVQWNFKVVDGGTPAGVGTFNVYLTAVPEPMTLSLLGAGALALIRRRR